MSRSVWKRWLVQGRPAVLLAGLLAAGCIVQPGDPRITYRRGVEPQPVKGATASGQWILYPGNATEPDRTVTVKEGEPLGFRRKADGSVVAVAGQQEFPLKPVLADEYYWKLERKTGE
ncbi:MAG: hypothetical protein ACJ79G_23725 [Myxococcales bacterium]